MTGFGEARAAARPVEEGAAHLALEQVQAAAHGRLRQCSALAARVKPPRRTMATNVSTWSSSMGHDDN